MTNQSGAAPWSTAWLGQETLAFPRKIQIPAPPMASSLRKRSPGVYLPWCPTIGDEGCGSVSGRAAWEARPGRP